LLDEATTLSGKPVLVRLGEWVSKQEMDHQMLCDVLSVMFTRFRMLFAENRAQHIQEKDSLATYYYPASERVKFAEREQSGSIQLSNIKLTNGDGS
jgi:hypothetical protein